MIKKILVLLIILIVGSLSAYSLSQYAYGTRAQAFDATSYGMANTGAAGSNSPLGIALNANNLFTQKGDIGFQVSSSVLKNEEKRSFPMYDSFDSYFNESTYISNENLYFNLGVATYAKYKLQSDMYLGMGVYYQPKYIFDADYLEEVRNNRNSDDDGYPEKIAENSINNEGSLDAFGLAFAYKLEANVPYLKSLALGANIEMLDGNADNETEVFWTNWAHETAGYGSLPNYKNTISRDLSGINIQANLTYEINHRTSFAFSYTPSTEIEVDGTYERELYTTYEDSLHTLELPMSLQDTVMSNFYMNNYDLPSSMRFALQFRPRNILRTVINFEIEAVNWSDTNDLFDDEFNYYVGAEHQIIETVPVRIGFSQTTSYMVSFESDVVNEGTADEEDVVYTYATRIQTPAVSIGSGFEFSEKVRMDLGLKYSFTEYETLDLFPDTFYDYSALWPNSHIDLQDRDWTNPDTVKENTFDLMMSLTYDF